MWTALIPLDHAWNNNNPGANDMRYVVTSMYVCMHRLTYVKQNVIYLSI